MTIKQIQESAGSRSVDLIGVVHQCGPVREKTLKSGVSKEIRNIQVADESGLAITVCLWGDAANKFDLGSDEHPIIAFKQATVSDFGGKSLNSNEDTQIILNPPHRRTKQLKDWYKFLPDPSQIQSLTQNK